MGPTIRSPTFVCTLSKERQIFKYLILTAQWDSHPQPTHQQKNINFMWKDFLGFYILINFIEPLETYLFLLYPNITNCLYSWVVFRKEKGISPMVPKLMPPTCGTRKNGPVIDLNVPCKQWNNMLD
jgi:hypothetical protein